MAVRAAQSEGPQLPHFYAGRELLITGATGFMGKVLIERLLSTCPEVTRLHLLVREKRGQAPDQRLAHLKQSQIFNHIRSRCPSQLDKLTPVPGDITEPLLGLDDKDFEALGQVSVVFHNAATIKLQEPLRDGISKNTLSAINVMDACDKLPMLKALVHVSTAFTNSELPHVEERVRETPATLQDVLTLLETCAPGDEDALTLKLIHPKPNTYFFTKNLAEIAVAQRQHRHYSVTIFRPSIVVSAHRVPTPGWIEGLAATAGVIVAANQGLLRVFNIKPSARGDMVPVDVAIDNMIAVGWETATEKPAEARVYYCGSQENPLRWGDVRDGILRNTMRYPMDDVLYYPYMFVFSNRYVCKAFELVLQTIPLYLLEYITNICGIKKRLSFITIAQRLTAMSKAIGSFACTEQTFSHDNMQRLRNKLLETDGHLFYLDIRDVNWQEHTSNFHLGARKFIMGQKDENLPRAREHMKRLRIIHCMVLFILALFTSLLVRFIARQFA